ncbi:MAG: hypothetical protein DRO18_07815 [Thermoprotei archaeon]|nr:MAG: hypothetical protein DRO18_07815 [Thermoprotei archaeon]HDN75730.1 ribbon-helix-helix protein, CopG family [Acidilobales archaeon]
MRIITFKIDNELLEVIDYLALRKGVYRSDIIRMALRQLIIRELESGVLKDIKKKVLERGMRF